MNFLKYILAVAAVFTLWACGPSAEEKAKMEEMEKAKADSIAKVKADSAAAAEKAARPNIVELAKSNENLSTLVSLIEEAGLAETLSGEGAFTVFAPTNDAFKKVPAAALAALKKDKAKLADVLKAHVVGQEVLAAGVVGMTEAPTLNGNWPVKVEGEKVMIGGATVTGTDMLAKNGVVHTIDTVLLPGKK